IGDDVEVETQRVAGANLTLKLRGVGKRGSLQERPSALRTGTTVRITIPNSKQSNFEGLGRIVQAKAPMLDVRIRVSEMDVASHVVSCLWQPPPQSTLFHYPSRLEVPAKDPMNAW